MGGFRDLSGFCLGRGKSPSLLTGDRRPLLADEAQGDPEGRPSPSPTSMLSGVAAMSVYDVGRSGIPVQADDRLADHGRNGGPFSSREMFSGEGGFGKGPGETVFLGKNSPRIRCRGKENLQ